MCWCRSGAALVFGWAAILGSCDADRVLPTRLHEPVLVSRRICVSGGVGARPRIGRLSVGMARTEIASASDSCYKAAINLKPHSVLHSLRPILVQFLCGMFVYEGGRTCVWTIHSTSIAEHREHSVFFTLSVLSNMRDLAQKAPTHSIYATRHDSEPHRLRRLPPESLDATVRWLPARCASWARTRPVPRRATVP